jgi:hypothetical protein
MTACDILNVVLNLEKEVTDHLHKVHECARGDNKLTADNSQCNKKQDCQVMCPQNQQVEKSMEDPHV